jgi:hypothetical protein
MQCELCKPCFTYHLFKQQSMHHKRFRLHRIRDLLLCTESKHLVIVLFHVTLSANYFLAMSAKNSVTLIVII